VFENYLSCPSDCGYFSLDGMCNIVPGKKYSFNDGACDEDCSHDTDQEDSEAGECFKPELVQCHSSDNSIIEQEKLFENVCLDDNQLVEYSCGLPKYLFWGSRVKSEIILCASGCSENTCYNPLESFNETTGELDLPAAPEKPPAI